MHSNIRLVISYGKEKSVSESEEVLRAYFKELLRFLENTTDLFLKKYNGSYITG